MTMGAILLFAQAAAAPAATAAAPPDIELTARIQAREVRIEQEGPIRLGIEVKPGISDVAVVRNQPAGAKSYRNLTIDARVAGWLRQGEDDAVTLSTESSTGEPPQ